MPLRILTGSANAGKTSAIYAGLSDHIAQGGRALLLLPSPADVALAMRELVTDCPIGLEITTLGGHLDAAWRVVGDGRRLVTAAQRALVLEECTRTCGIDSLAGSARTPGLRRMLAGLVQRAVETDLSEDEELRAHGDPGTGLLRLIDAYLVALHKAGLVERGEAYRTVAKHVDSLDLPGLVAINRFTGLTGPQERYVVAASARQQVVISLTYSPLLAATETATELVSRLGVTGTVEEVVSTHVHAADDELRAIERGFGTQRAVPLMARGAVIVSEAWGRSSEAARIVAEVQDAHEAGIESGEIAVVFRDPVTHIRALDLAFSEADMTVDWDIQIPFERTGLGRALLSLIGICSGAADRATWVDFMRSPYSPLPLDDVDELDTRIRRLGVRGADAARQLDSWLRGSAATFMRQARFACSRMTDESSEGRWHALAMAMIGRAHPKAGVLGPEGLLDASAARSLIDVVSGLRELGYVGMPASVLGSALRGAPVSMGGTQSSDRVQVMSADRIRGRRFRCVIVGGLTSGEFPRSRRDEGYGALGADAVLARAGIDIAPRDDVSAERLLFYQVITRARERLVLSRRSHDDGGQSIQPSVFLEEVLDLYGGEGEGPGLRSGIGRTVLGLDVGCRSVGAPCTSRREMRSVVQQPGRSLASARTRCSALASGSSGDRRYTLSGDTQMALRRREVFSVSDIEVYMQCPYRWFIGRVIRPSDLDTRLEASSTGQAVHEVLARVYDRFAKETGAARVTPETLGHALSVLQVVIDEVLAEMHPQSAQEAVELHRSLVSTSRVLVDDATLLQGFDPIHREWSFGLSEGDDPEPLDGYLLSGRIDRIDCSKSHLVITDYKSGSVGPERGVRKFAEKGLVQLPLYAYVASRRLGLDVAGAVYRSVARGDLRGFVSEGLRGKPFVSTDVVDAGGVEEVITSARERAAEAVEGMRAGVIEAAPSDGRCPSFCAARSFCFEGGQHRA